MKRGSRKFSDDAVITRETSAISRIELVGQTEELSKTLFSRGLYLSAEILLSLLAGSAIMDGEQVDATESSYSPKLSLPREMGRADLSAMECNVP